MFLSMYEGKYDLMVSNAPSIPSLEFLSDTSRTKLLADIKAGVGNLFQKHTGKFGGIFYRTLTIDKKEKMRKNNR